VSRAMVSEWRGQVERACGRDRPATGVALYEPATEVATDEPGPGVHLRGRGSLFYVGVGRPLDVSCAGLISRR